jgi:outer membrane receptor protein involved in Fe transport
MTTRSVDSTDAVFGQATVNLTQDLRVTLGARYTQDKIATGADTQSSCPFGTGTTPFQTGFDITLGPGLTCASLNIPNFSQVVVIPAVTAKFSHPSYLGGVEYDVTPHVMAYASVSTGYRTGGVSETDPAIVLYRPETNTSYEAGVRARIFDNSVSLNLTAFREIYRDMQVQFLAIRRLSTRRKPRSTASKKNSFGPCHATIGLPATLRGSTPVSTNSPTRSAISATQRQTRRVMIWRNLLNGARASATHTHSIYAKGGA